MEFTGFWIQFVSKIVQVNYLIGWNFTIKECFIFWSLSQVSKLLSHAGATMRQLDTPVQLAFLYETKFIGSGISSERTGDREWVWNFTSCTGVIPFSMNHHFKQEKVSLDTQVKKQSIFENFEWTIHNQVILFINREGWDIKVTWSIN